MLKEKSLTNSNLNEGLRAGDLRDLLIPVLSIDEYESKISSNAEVIVVGFFIETEEAADDLSRFINRSANAMLDTDVSPAPTESGYFVMFVEFTRDAAAFESIQNILIEIQNVVNIKESDWTFKGYQTTEIKEFNEQNFNESVRVSEPTHESFKLNKFFGNALIESIGISDEYVTIKSMTFKITDFKSLQESTYSASFHDLALARQIDSMLGMHYSSSVVGNEVQINNVVRGETIYATVS